MNREVDNGPDGYSGGVQNARPRASDGKRLDDRVVRPSELRLQIDAIREMVVSANIFVRRDRICASHRNNGDRLLIARQDLLRFDLDRLPRQIERTPMAHRGESSNPMRRLCR